MSKSLFKKYEHLKKEEFKENNNLNELLNELIILLKPLQKNIEKEIGELKWPVFLIVGCPRSGTTLLTQWLGSLGFFSYPSNLLTRFAYAPYLGALIQKMLFDEKFDFHGDFQDIQSKLNFDSYLGKSKGALATNEFQHFFRNYLNHFDPEFINNEELKKVDVLGMAKGLASIEKGFNKPFITKGFMLQYNLEYFVKNIPKLVPVHIERDPSQNMQSIYAARQKYFGNEEIWLGAKPKEYEQLKTLDVFHQIAGQVYYTNKYLKSISEKLSSEGHPNLHVSYEEFCKNPEGLYNKLIAILNKNNYSVTKPYKGKSEFDVQSNFSLNRTVIDKLETAYSSFKSINE